MSPAPLPEQLVAPRPTPGAQQLPPGLSRISRSQLHRGSRRPWNRLLAMTAVGSASAAAPADLHAKRLLCLLPVKARPDGQPRRELQRAMSSRRSSARAGGSLDVQLDSGRIRN